MKKLMAIFLALLMLALPMVGLAEGDFISEAAANGRSVMQITTFDLMQSTGDETVDQIVNELLDALAILSYWQEAGGSQSGVRVVLGDTIILYLDAATADEQLYLKSDLLADDTVVLSEKDVEPIAEKVLSALAAEGIIDEDDVASAMEQLKTALAQSTNPMADVDFEAIMNGFDFTELVKFAEGVAERIEETDLSGKPGDCDPAEKAYVIRVTAEDIVKVYDIIFEALKANKEYLALLDTMNVSFNDEPMSAEDAINQMQQTIDQDFAKMLTSDVPVTVYLNGDGEAVAATMGFTMDMSAVEGGDPQPVAADVVYKRATDGERVLHSVLYTIDMKDSKAVMTVDAAVEGNTVDVDVMINADEESVSVSFKKAEEVTDTEKTVNARFGLGTQEMSLAVTYTANAKKDGVDAEQTAVVTLSMDGNDLVSMTTASKTTDPLESIATADAIRPAEMPQEEFQTWFFGLINNLQGWAVKVLQSLPQSVLMLMIGQ